MERAGGCFAIGDDGIIRELCRSNRLESKELGEREKMEEVEEET